MSFNRARYVTICQQVLVTATTVAVGLSAAGVMTLTIVTPEESVSSADASDLSAAVYERDRTYVEAAPVEPKVREIAIAPEAAPQPERTTSERPAPVRTWKPQAHLTPAAVTAPEKVDDFTTVGVVWDGKERLEEDAISVEVRTRTGGTWSGWTAAPYHDDHGPDAGSAEAGRERAGTDALVVGDVDDVQVRAATRDGKLPSGMKLAVISPGKGKQRKAAPAIDTAKLDGGVAGEEPTAAKSLAGADLQLSAMAVAPKPTIYSRAQWGADESLRDCSPSYGTIKAGYVHHTVNANDYTAAQVPGIIRSIYKYHTGSRGWCDVGYNFLIDKFGRIWEGRAGGVDRPVVGAHTYGYNEVVFAGSAIGNFDTANPPGAVTTAFAQLMAWKLSLYDVNAAATKLWVKDAYMQAINGHRDSPKASTACPGRYLYARVPDIRTAARNIQLRTDSGPVPAPAGMPAPTTAPKAATALPTLALKPRISLGGSGWPDVAFKAPSGAIRVLATNGLVGYHPRVATGGGWENMNALVAVGDMNGDGNGDVLGRTAANGYTRIYPGRGDGHVGTTGFAGTYAFRYANLVLGVGDWNRDGRRDVMSRDRRNSNLYVHLGAGGGKFAAPVLVRRGWSYTLSSGAGDLTGDGIPDLMGWSAGDSRVWIFPGAGGTGVRTPVAGPVLRDIDRIAGWGDQTGDGKADLVFRKKSGYSYILGGTGKGGFLRTYGAFGNMAGLAHLSEGPMNGGRADLVGRDSAGNLVVVRNNERTNGQGWLASSLNRPGASALVQVGDWNRDGHNDLITREGDGGKILVVWPGTGDGRFGRGHSLGGGWATINRVVGVGDVTGDGFPDLAGSINDGRTIIWPGNGWNGIKAPQYAPSTMRVYNAVGGAWGAGKYLSVTRTFVPAGGTSYVGTIPGYDLVMGVGDVNGDGRADVLARSTTGDLRMLPGKPSGGYGPWVWVASGLSGYQAMG